MKIVDVKQGSSEWFAARCGIPTASEFDKLVTPLWKVREGDGFKTYVLQKVAEKVMGEKAPAYQSPEMEEGAALEAEAVAWYEFHQGTPVQRVGFCLSDCGRFGCSPDGLVGEDGGLELKCPQPPAHIRYLVDGVLPKDHAAQVQGSLFVTKRKWWSFASYSRNLPPFLISRIEPEEAAQKAIAAALARFREEFDAAWAKVAKSL